MRGALGSFNEPPSRSHGRLVFTMAVFAGLYALIIGQLLWLGTQTQAPRIYSIAPPALPRPNIVDRAGNILAMNVPSTSVFAEPRRIIDADEATEGLLSVFPDLDPLDLRTRLKSEAAFSWIKRKITPYQKAKILSFGIPGIGFQEEPWRLYTNGSIGSHVLGAVNIDNAGISGIERWLDTEGLNDSKRGGLTSDGKDLTSIVLSLDLRVQFALTDELRKAVQRFSAVAGAGLVLDVTNGEVIALVSLPDFDPGSPAGALKPESINRISVATYEMGSTFKAMTTAMALDSGLFNLASQLDASQPLRFGRMAIRDYRGQNRVLNVPEAFIYSSNIAMGRMALGVGPEKHRAFLRSLGQFDRLVTELPENAMPIIPRRWSEITTATAAFGHGVAVTPLQAAVGIAALVNGGDLIQPTFIKGSPLNNRILARNVVTAKTGEALRFLMRLNAEVGSAAKADVPGYFIGGKTGTSEKVVDGRYSSNLVLTAFMGVVPANKPKYLFLTILDEPKGLPETFGFRTSGWNAVPVTGEIMKRILPMLLPPSFSRPNNPFPLMVADRVWGSERFMPITDNIPGSVTLGDMRL